MNKKFLKDLEGTQNLSIFNSRYRGKTFVILLLWFIRFFVYFGIQFQIDVLSDEKDQLYFNFT